VRAETATLDRLVGVQTSADLVDVGAVAADAFVELVASDAKLFGPVSDVGGHFGVNLFGVVRTFDSMIFVDRVGFMGFGGVVVLGHGYFLFSVPLVG
jgi:hypothetical protein